MQFANMRGTAVLIMANILFWSVLSFYQAGRAAQPGPGQPFANSVQQRNEIIQELKKTNGLLKEQNALLRSGKLTVVVKNP